MKHQDVETGTRRPELVPGRMNEVPPDLVDFVPGYLARRQEDILVMERCLRKRDFEAIGHVVHKIKGNAASFGFYRIFEISLQLEAAVEERSLERVSDALGLLQMEVVQLRLEFPDLADSS